jgi:hypothetical protein
MYDATTGFALSRHLRAQAEMLEEFSRRAMAATDWRMRSAWIGEFVRLSHALTATALVSGSFEKVQTLNPLASALLVSLRLPKLPALPKEGDHPSPQNPQNNLRRNFERDQRLATPTVSPLRGEPPPP